MAQLWPGRVRLAEGVASVCRRSLPPRRQHVDEAVAGPTPLTPAHCPHRAGHGDVGGAFPVGLVQLGDEAPFLGRLRHALHMRVQGGQGLVCNRMETHVGLANIPPTDGQDKLKFTHRIGRYLGTYYLPYTYLNDTERFVNFFVFVRKTIR